MKHLSRLRRHISRSLRKYRVFTKRGKHLRKKYHI